MAYLIIYFFHFVVFILYESLIGNFVSYETLAELFARVGILSLITSHIYLAVDWLLYKGLK